VGRGAVRFADALAQEETAEAFEGAGLAARYELDAEAAIEAHERGYRLARSRGDAATATRLGVACVAGRKRRIALVEDPPTADRTPRAVLDR
jgi:hypothetical protein